MRRDIKSSIRPVRLDGLPEGIRRELKGARLKRGWSQAELGRRASLPQMHISGIESGKIVPRFDTLLDLVRVLDFDLLMVPRALVPAVHALVRDHRNQDQHRDDGERSLYAYAADDDEPEARGQGHDEV
jgi:transcriptional regulator with XRE-family HTH domain